MSQNERELQLQEYRVSLTSILTGNAYEIDVLCVPKICPKIKGANLRNVF